MFVKNVKLNGKFVFKIVFVILLILILVVLAVGIYKMLNAKEASTPDCSNLTKNRVNVISSSNYTNVLKIFHAKRLSKIRNLHLILRLFFVHLHSQKTYTINLKLKTLIHL